MEQEKTKQEALETMRYKVRNNVHNTKAYTEYSPQQRERIMRKARKGDATTNQLKEMRRVKQELCGVKGCNCGGDRWGER